MIKVKMKNKLLITTALTALISVSNTYADALTIAEGDIHNITADETVDSLSMTGGRLIGAPDVDGALTVLGTTNISGGTISLTSYLDAEDESKDRYSSLEMQDEVTISGNDTVINMTDGYVSALAGLEISGGKITMNKESDLTGTGQIKIFDGEISAGNTSTITGNHIIMSGGIINMNNESELISIDDFDISGGIINLNDNAKMIQGVNFSDPDEEFVASSLIWNINMTGGVVNMNDTSSIEIYTTGGKLALDGSSITGSTVEELLAQAPTININGNNKINSNIDIKDGLLKVNKGATLTSGDINLTSGNFASIIDVSGTLDANVTGSDKARMTFFDSAAKVKGTVAGIKDINVRSNLSLASVFEKGATDIDNINVYGSTLTLDNENFNEAKNLILNNQSTAKLAGDFTASNKVKVKDGSVLDLGTSTLNAANVELFENAQVNLKIAALDNHGAIVASDKIIFVGGNATDGYSNGANKNINLNVTMDGDLVQKGETADLTLLSANNGFEGDFNKIDVANNRYAFEQTEVGKFKVTGVATGEDVVKNAGGSINNAGTAAAWVDGDSFKDGTQAAAVANSLNELSQKVGSEQAYVDALTALAPETAAMVQSASTENANQVFGAVGTRLSGGSVSTGGEGMSSGDSVFKRGAVWTQGLFNKSKLDDTHKAKGFDADSTGIAMGVEKYINDDVKAGIGYAYTDTDIDGFMRKTDVDTHTAIIYGEYKPSNWFVNGIATYGWSDYSEKKNVAGNQIKADYDVDTIGLQAMTGYDMKFCNGTTITPEAGLRYVNIRQDSYRDSAGQRVGENTSDILTGVIGAKINKNFSLENGMNLRPEARFAMTYDLKNDGANSVVSLANGSAYQVRGEALDRFGVEVGAGLTADVNDNVELSLGYEGKFREDYRDHTGLFNAKYKF